MNPGDDLALSGTTAAAQPSLAGEVVEDDVRPFADAGAGVSGQIQLRVVRTGAGTLDFCFRVREISGGRLWVAACNLVGPTVSVDSDYRLDGLGDVGPARVNRTDFGSDATFDHVASLEWYFGGMLGPGQSSRFVHVKTDATDYVRNDSLNLTGAPRPDGTSAWQVLVSWFVPVDHY